MLSFASTGSLKSMNYSNNDSDKDGNEVENDEYTNDNSNEDIMDDEFKEGVVEGMQGGLIQLPVFPTLQPNIESIVSLYSSKLTDILERHKEQPMFYATLNAHMSSIEMIVEKAMNEQLARNEKREQYEKEKNLLIAEYLQGCPYYYLPEVKLFIEYTGEGYSVVQESRIWSDVLESIERVESMIPHKYKIRTEVLQLIRQRHLWRCTPESPTIQGVLHLLTSFFFTNKENAKYFLTIIGDELFNRLTEHSQPEKKRSINAFTYICNRELNPLLELLSYHFSRYVKHRIHTIFKKNVLISNSISETPSVSATETTVNLIINSDNSNNSDNSDNLEHLEKKGVAVRTEQPPQLQFQEDIMSEQMTSNNESMTTLSNALTTTSQNPLSNIRLLLCRTDIPSAEYWEEHVRSKILDIISVAFHYSLRFDNAENFLETYCSLPSVYNSIKAVSNYDLQSLISKFMDSSISIQTYSHLNSMKTEMETETEMTTITEEKAVEQPPLTSLNLAYLWKSFIVSFLGVDEDFLLRPAIKQIQENLALNTSIAVLNKQTLYKRLEIIYQFKQFVVKTMTLNKNEMDVSFNSQFLMDEVYVYEIDELLNIFKLYIQMNCPVLLEKVQREIGTDELLKILNHFYRDTITIVDNKNIYGWKCSMWNKPAIIMDYLATTGRAHKYTDFCKFLKEAQITLIPSKAYYDMFV